MTGRRTALLVVFVVLVLTVACGVPTDEGPYVAKPRDVPFGLLDRSTPSSSTTTTAVAARPLQVFFVRGALIVGAPRGVEGPLTLRGALDLLLAGPTEEELDDGLRSALRTEDAASAVAVSRGVAHVALTPDFSTASSEEQLFGLAQIVYTATETPGVGAVQFQIDGTLIEVPRPDGSLTGAPVTREDFAVLAAR